MTNRLLLLFAFALACLGLSAQSLKPSYSTAEEPIWYQVVFKNGGWALTDKGAGAQIKTAKAAADDAQKWQFIGDDTGFLMKSKAGRYVGPLSDGRFTAVSAKTQAIKFRLVEGSAEGYWEIQRTASTSAAMNMWGGAGDGKAIGEYTVGDNGNQLSFMSLTAVYPEFSTEDGSVEKYYFIRFAASGKYFAENADDDLIRLNAADCVGGQMWKFVGTKDNFLLQNKNGNYAYVSSQSVDTEEGGLNGNPVRYGKDATTGHFSMQQAPNVTNGVGFEIVALDKSGNNVMNQWGGQAGRNTIGFWQTNDKNNVMMFVAEDAMTYPDFKVTGSTTYRPENQLTLWYTQPATLTGAGNIWMEYSLPIGNGQLGASLFGGVATDEIQFNEKTLWSGSPSKYGYYENFGSVLVENLDTRLGYGSDKPATDYYRQLDLTTGQGRVGFALPDGSVTFTREYLASNPDGCIAVRYAASQPGQLSLRFTLNSGEPGIKVATEYAEGQAVFKGKLDVVSYNARMRVVPTGGEMVTSENGIEVTNADEVLLVLVGATDFDNNYDSYISGTAELAGRVQGLVDAAAAKGWNELSAAQKADHAKYMGRVALQLGNAENVVPTNELVDTYAHGEGTHARMLEQLYFAYGRYLEIASSRGVDVPSNLQGIWNNNSYAPWHSDIHANINVQMNYWPAESGNMSEMHMPFLNYIIKQAVERPEWHNFAVDIAKQTKGWTLFTENNIFGGKSDFMLNYVIANAWYCSHLWQHYRYTLDKDFLARAFPAMWSCAEFWMERLVKASDGTYECPKEYSPEHGPGAENATAHSQQLVWELFDNVQKSMEILGDAANVEAADKAKFEEMFANLDKGLAIETYEGDWDNTRLDPQSDLLREWKYSSYNNSSADRNHRHMSHLMCVYPFNQVTPSSPYFEAAVNSMKLRGDASTGWSMGWKINLWARALNGERAHNVLATALRHSTSYGTNQAAGGIYYNLYDSHSPFQIDGNFGATAGVIEMLMQSATDTISILPALPAAWTEGSVKGLKAVGDFTVGIDWAKGKAVTATIVSNQGQPLYVRYDGIASRLVTVNGTEVQVEIVNKDVVKVPAKAGDVVTIDFGNISTGIDRVENASEASLGISIDKRCISVNANDVANVRLVDMAGRIVAHANGRSLVAPDGHAFIVEATLKSGDVKRCKVSLK